MFQIYLSVMYIFVLMSRLSMMPFQSSASPSQGASMLNRIAARSLSKAATLIEKNFALASEDTTVEKMRPMFGGHLNRLLKVARI